MTEGRAIARLPPRRLDARFVLRSLAVVGVAVSVRAFFIAFAPFVSGDASEYDGIALNLIRGNGYSLSYPPFSPYWHGDPAETFPTTPTALRPPVYPLFLAGIYAALGPHPGYALAAQALGGGLAAWILYLLGRRILGERVGLIGAVVAGAYPHLAFWAATITVETLAFLLLALTTLGASYLAERRAPALALAVGVGFGLCALTSPRLAALPAAVLAAVALRRMPVRRLATIVALAVAGYAAVLAPWVVRNEIVFRTFVPLTLGQQAANMWLSAIRAPLYDYDWPEWAKTEPLMARILLLYHDPHYASRERDTVTERLRLEDDLRDDTWRRIAADPGGFLAYRIGRYPALWIQPAVYAGRFAPPFTGFNLQLGDMVRTGLWGHAMLRGIAVVVFTGGLSVGAVLGAIALRRRLPELAFLGAPAVYMGIVHSLSLVEQQYSVLSHPFLWLIAVTGWDGIRRALARRGS